MKRLLLGLTGAGLAVLLAAFATGAVLAEDGDGTPGPWGNFWERLARNLGIEESRLREAVTQTQLELIDEAESTGRISEEAAERLRRRVQEGAPFFGPALRDGHGRPGHFFHPADPIGVVAEATGLSEDEVRAELRAGKTLAQVGQEHGVSRDDLSRALVDAVEESLDRAVEAGKLTQERADQILERYREHVDSLLDRTWPRARERAGS